MRYITTIAAVVALAVQASAQVSGSVTLPVESTATDSGVPSSSFTGTSLPIPSVSLPSSIVSSVPFTIQTSTNAPSISTTVSPPSSGGSGASASASAPSGSSTAPSGAVVGVKVDAFVVLAMGVAAWVGAAL